MSYEGNVYEYVEWISECCDAGPISDLDMSTVLYGGPSGYCSVCKDNCIFVPAEDPGDHFDTKEEKRGER